jgi:peptide/nickel transport system permease protein
MVSYIIRRVLYACLIVVLVSVTVFALIRMLPGDPIEMLVSQDIMQQASRDPAYYARLRSEYGLDKPMLIQFVDWFAKMLRGDFGKSIIRKYDILTEMKSRILVTLSLGIASFVISNIVGILLGIVSAVRRGGFIDTVVTVIANIGITAPTFWVAILLIYFFGFKLNLFPLYGYVLPWKDFGLSMQQSVLPIFVMALGPISMTCRQTRSSLIEVLTQDHVRSAWSKGPQEREVIGRPVLKNGLMPVVTLQGTMIAMIFGGSAIVETIFVIPGMGKMMVDGMMSQDYPVVQVVTLMLTFVVVLANLLVDLMYGWIDPRIQYD